MYVYTQWWGSGYFSQDPDPTWNNGYLSDFILGKTYIQNRKIQVSTKLFHVQFLRYEKCSLKNNGLIRIRVFFFFFVINLNPCRTVSPVICSPLMDFYQEILELNHKAKMSDIKKAYFVKAKIYHPDAFPKHDKQSEFRAEIATTLSSLVILSRY